jgi:hypothetical protein
MRTLALAILIQAVAPWAGFAAPLRMLDEKLPPRVVEITRKQIERYLGTNDVTGVPILDRTVDWNFFTNWPDQFSFKGHTYRLNLTDTSGGDSFAKLKSRTEIQPGMRFLAGYSTDTSSRPPLRVSSGWRGDGSLAERSVTVEGKHAFTHQFVPSGRFCMFSREDAETKEYILEYFDASGRLVGTVRGAGTKRKCEWDGVVIDPDAFSKKSRELYNQFEK